MLTISPEKDKLFLEKIFSNCHADGMEPAVLTAKENGKLLGYAAIDLKDYTVRILEFAMVGNEKLTGLSTEEQQLADSLIKAVASYAMNRNVFLLSSSYEPAFPLLTSFGFQQNDNKMRIDLSRLIKKCKRC
mgnify:CR=1 FL=1